MTVERIAEKKEELRRSIQDSIDKFHGDTGAAAIVDATTHSIYNEIGVITASRCVVNITVSI